MQGIQNVSHPTADHHPPTNVQVYLCEEVLFASLEAIEISFCSSEGVDVTHLP